jgi:hypothetical protein
MRLQFKKEFKVGSAVFLLTLVTLATSGCGQSFNDALGRGTSSTQSSNSGSSTGGATKTEVWSGVDTQGVASNFIFGTHQIFRIDTVNNLLILSIPISGMPFGTGAFPINQLPGATIMFTTSGIDITVPLKDLVKGVGFSNPSTLPNGNPLPGIPGGELPRIGGTVQNSNFTLDIYGSVKYFAIFVPVPQLDKYLNYINLIGGQLTLPIMNKGKTKTLGYFSIIAPTGNFDGGFYLSLVFPPELAAALDNLFS